jgi:hypothetical protein
VNLVLVHAPGLTVDHAVRGDVAANLSDLIAEGCLAPLAGAPDVEEAVKGLGGLERVTLPFTDLASFDDAVGELRARKPGTAVAILSESLLIAPVPVAEIRPGRALAAADVAGVLAKLTA